MCHEPPTIHRPEVIHTYTHMYVYIYIYIYINLYIYIHHSGAVVPMRYHKAYLIWAAHLGSTWIPFEKEKNHMGPYGQPIWVPHWHPLYFAD